MQPKQDTENLTGGERETGLGLYCSSVAVGILFRTGEGVRGGKEWAEGRQGSAIPSLAAGGEGGCSQPALELLRHRRVVGSKAALMPLPESSWKAECARGVEKYKQAGGIPDQFAVRSPARCPVSSGGWGCAGRLLLQAGGARGCDGQAAPVCP